MTLYVLNSNQYSSLFGTPEEPTPKQDVDIIAQTPDCSAFLVLSDTAYPELIEQAGIPDGFDLTYCQQWGLTVNADVVARVKKELRTKKVSRILVTTTAGNTFNGDEKSQDRMSRAIIAAEGILDLISWRLENNSVIEIPIEELREALLLAGTKQTEMWFI
jgi:hypothetical protein